LEGLTLKRVGVEAGGSRGFSGVYFTTKADLVEALIDHLYGSDELPSLLRVPEPGLTPLLNALETYFSRLLAISDAVRALHIIEACAVGDGATARMVAHHSAAVRNLIEGHIHAGKMKNEVSWDVTDNATAALILTSVRAYMVAHLREPDPDQFEAQKMNLVGAWRRALELRK
jgi:AcrR family transcriptional regulator